MSKRQIPDETTTIVACIQMEPAVREKQRNIKRSLEMIDEAAGRGARLLVLPELANSGYVFETRAEAFDLSEQVPDGDTCKTWVQACERHDASGE
jgi:predicted amidohydrolase